MGERSRDPTMRAVPSTVNAAVRKCSAIGVRMLVGDGASQTPALFGTGIHGQGADRRHGTLARGNAVPFEGYDSHTIVASTRARSQSTNLSLGLTHASFE